LRRTILRRAAQRRPCHAPNAELRARTCLPSALFPQKHLRFPAAAPMRRQPRDDAPPMQIELDSRDRTILRILQSDGRITNSDLAEKVHLSPSACLRRVRQLEESGLIRGYVMMLDEKIAGFPGTAFVFVTLDQQGRASLESFEQAVQGLPEILECHLLAGAHDYLMRVIYRDSADFERIHTDIITQLPGVTRVQSTLTLRTIKKTSALPM
jgi:Lrp/AsnC family leucine-responsive transcriptional regulator